MKTITLSNGWHVAVVNDEDFDLVSRYRWHLSRNQWGNLYAYTWLNAREREAVSMHCLILPGFQQVHHRDGLGLNNTRRNLEGVTSSHHIAKYHRRGDGVSYESPS